MSRAGREVMTILVSLVLGSVLLLLVVLQVGRSLHPRKPEIAASEALLFVTPEYNRSIPGSLKKATEKGRTIPCN